MNNEEAKYILQAYRLNGQDAQDPQFREALEQLKRDPELARWFAEERAIDSRIGAKLKAGIKAPVNLKALLLAQRTMVHPAPWWRQPQWLATAWMAMWDMAVVGVAPGTRRCRRPGRRFRDCFCLICAFAFVFL